MLIIFSITFSSTSSDPFNKLKTIAQLVRIIYDKYVEEVDINKVLNAVRKIELPFNLVAMDFKKSIAKQIKQADKLDCQLLLIVGTEEMSNNILTIKDLKSDRDDRSISFDDFSKFIEEY